MVAPLLVMYAGLNGEGKSTFYEADMKILALPFPDAEIPAHEKNS